jgi:hypothetical protein
MGTRLLELASEFEGELNAGQVQPALFHKIFNLTKLFNIAIRIETQIARRPRGCDKTLALVLAKRLRMHFD